MSVLFPSTREALSWAGVAALVVGAVGWRVVPSSWRPASALSAAVATAATYVAIAVSYDSGLGKWIDREIFERMRGGIDDAATWLVGLAGAAVGLAIVAGARRILSR